MKIALAHRKFIRQANELGYFPDVKQAKQISHLSAKKYFSAVGIDRSKKLSLSEMHAIDEAAIKEVMEGGPEARSEDLAARDAFYRSDEGKALLDGKTKPWQCGQRTIERANELGYFPTEKQSKQIDHLAASRGWHGIKEHEIDSLSDWAIEEFMEKASHPRAAR